MEDSDVKGPGVNGHFSENLSDVVHSSHGNRRKRMDLYNHKIRSHLFFSLIPFTFSLQTLYKLSSLSQRIVTSPIYYFTKNKVFLPSYLVVVIVSSVLTERNLKDP